ncbi:MAG TPA: PEP-CTERM sorting domain-containing protein [Gemmataceae bacterium]|jgi:hypothetical protein|nr:PEP-CTERM sorting domain-containing protein [Gemmataceae bacterium]
MSMNRRFFVALLALFVAGPGFGQTLRIVSWNTANDVSGTGGDTHPPTIGGPADAVFRAIGALSVTGSAPARPIDVLALQESAINTGTGVNATAQAYANVLNSIYPGANYVAATLNATTDGAATGNGPNTLVYRSTTVTLLSQAGIGTVSSSGAARQVARYQFQPVGYSSSAAFYLYDDHFKSGTTTTDDNRRGVEATTITNDVSSLPANTPVVFAGDYNSTNQTADQGYHGVTTGSASNHGIDPLNPAGLTQTWDNTIRYETESPATSAAFTGQSTGGMHFRDDFLLNSPGMLSGNLIKYIAGSSVSFGNTATFDASGNQINPATHSNSGAISSSNAAAFAAELSGQYTTSGAGNVLTSLTQASDHLPVVADYQLTAVPEPSSLLLLLTATPGIAFLRRRQQSSRRQPTGAPPAHTI